MVGGFSVGMMTFPINGKIKAMFQATNQIRDIEKPDGISPDLVDWCLDHIYLYILYIYISIVYY